MFEEGIKCGNEISNAMYFTRFAVDATFNNQKIRENAESFFYFITKLNKKVRIPIRGFNAMIKKDCSL
jgi:hypothetical protein